MRKMREYINKKTIRRLDGLLFLVVMLLGSLDMRAEGSRDLHPSGKEGRRAYLRAYKSTAENYPFANEGIHYVYVKSGETITLASSAQGKGGNARMRLYDTKGNLVVNEVTAGQIPNRVSELAGPQLQGGTVANRYTPVYYRAAVSGIYRVEFVGPATAEPGTSVDADVNWTQPVNTSGIMAWDVSVINTANTGFIPGRVYTNVLNLSNGTAAPATTGFYGVLFTLTKDGYTYRVNNNGNNGMYFTFMVNNNGFINASTGDPLYKSLNTTTNLNGRVHSPNVADNAKQITHKMFYTLPAADLPATSQGAVPGGTTWLKNPVVKPDVKDVQLKGADGTPGQISNKGGLVEFSAAVQGSYTVVIESTDTPASFVTRTMAGTAVAGFNQVSWDGKDGAGNPLPAGSTPAKITVQLQGAEVHFPFFDMEYNKNGFILELLDHNNLNNVVSDIVYWNDIDVANPTNGSASNPRNNSHLPADLGGVDSNGISSKVNGHIWGIGGSGANGLFGDLKSIDTWTFIKGEAQTTVVFVFVSEADLKITSVTPDKGSLRKGDEITYTVKVGNDGPSDVTGSTFTFKIPDGFDPVDMVFSGNGCGAESMQIEYDAVTHTYTSKLDLPDGCEITYEIKVKATDPETGSVEVEAAILRPNDVTDPDATNTNQGVPPTDAHYECDNNGLSVPCNNIKTNNVVTYSNPEFILIKDGVFNDESGNGLARAGETITYTLTLKNTGDVNLADIILNDPLLGGEITVIPEKSINADDILDVGETWTYKLEYTLTAADISSKGVYNRANAGARDTITGDDIEKESVPAVPLQPGDPGYDPYKPDHTYVPLKVRSFLITNPMIRQRIK